jgi:hypothetical protein
MDFLITTLPIPLILHLQMSRERKYSIVCLIGLGYIVTIAGAVRTYYVYVVFWRTWDITWYEYSAILASVVENNLSVVSFSVLICLVPSNCVSSADMRLYTDASPSLW